MSMENLPFEDVFPIEHGDLLSSYPSFQGCFFSIINASKNHISSVIRTAELSKFCRWDLPKKDNPVSLHDLDF